MAPSALPDVNAPTHPFETVQYHLDRATWLNLYAAPIGRRGEQPWLVPDRRDYFGINGGYGFDLASRLHRFDSRIRCATDGSPRIRQAVGRPLGEVRARVLFGPPDLSWAPGREPPIRIFDPWRPQSFALLDVAARFGSGDDGFRGYGTGRTYPISVGGRPVLLAAAVGNVETGYGRLGGLEATFVLNGHFHELGFEGSLTCRVVDPEMQLAAGDDPSPVEQTSEVSPLSTFVVLRGQKADPSVRTEYGPPPGQGLVSLVTPAQMRAVEFGTTAEEGGGPRSRMQVGEVVANLLADVSLDILAPPGTSERPNGFTTHNTYTFAGGDADSANAIEARVELGRSFALSFPGLPDQPAMRYGGVGPVVGSRGRLSGAVGLLSVNSAIGVAPHALSMLNILQIVDPEGLLRRKGG